MDEKSDEILEHIETQRNQLGANLNELETRVRRSTDWRTHFDRNPMLMLAGAVGGGILLGAMVNGVRSRAGRSSYTSSRHFVEASSNSITSNTATSLQRHRASETIDNIKAALIAFATTKAKDFLNEALPGFEQHFREAQYRGSQSPSYSTAEYPQGRGSDYTSGDYRQSGYGEQTSGSGQGANYGQNQGPGYGGYRSGQGSTDRERAGYGNPTYGNS
jgi:hypothetical protein